MPRQLKLFFGSLCALLTASLLSIASLAPAHADQALYTDSLQNGWSNYSWAATTLDTAAPVHTGSDSISVQSGAYQALYLHHDAQAASGFTAVTFWINGGEAGGQKLQVQATLGGAPQAAYALTTPAANTWTQVTVPLSALGVTAQTNFDGLWIQDTSGQSSVPVYYVDDMTLTSAPIGPVTTAITIDAAANHKPISVLIYGVAYGSTRALLALNAPLNRLGGNDMTRYNWQLNASSKAADYFFESIGDPSAVPGERADTFVAASKAGGAQSMLTIPMLGWTATLGPNRQILPSFSVTKYGPQSATDPYLPDAGNGVSGGTSITGNDPADANIPVDASFQAGWLTHLVGKWNHANRGGVRYYILDNEPSLWSGTHRDVHPQGETMDEIKTDLLTYSALVKAADRTALVVGPEEWGWPGYLYSGADQDYRRAHGYRGSPDKDAHGGMDSLPWLLDQLHQSDAVTGRHSLDYFSVHFYPQSNEFSNNVDTATVLLRNRSTRQLWDPSYVSESYIADTVMLIPRMKSWVNSYYPGLRTAITEYNWGAENDINGATTQADIYGIFGREGLDMANRWTVPDPSTPTFKAMQMYRNYDGKRSGFGDTSVSDITPDPDTVSSFAATRRADGALTVFVINKSPLAPSAVTLSLANFTPGASAQVWQLTSSNAITRLTDAPLSGTTLMLSVPAQSITLLVIFKQPPNKTSSRTAANK